MLRGLEQSSYHKRGKLGTRTQLINIRTKKLEMDLKYEGDGNYFHVLNAVSPAFTCSMPFADYLVEQIVKRIR